MNKDPEHGQNGDGAPDHLAAQQGQVALDMDDLVLGHREVVAVQHDRPVSHTGRPF